MRFALLLIALFSAIVLASPAQAAPNVVVSIKPIHSLVSAVMQGVGEPHLIVRGGATPHTFNLRPSDAAALADADLIFWIGPELENFLDGTIGNLAPNARSIEVSALAGIALLPLREDANFEHHEHGDEDHGEEGHDHEELDMHLWLDPRNAKAIVEASAAELIELDPQNAALYRANSNATVKRLDQMQSEIAAELAPFGDTPFVSFHDAYQYFEHRFGVAAAGAITLNPDSQPGARRVAEVRETIMRLGAVCVFIEPQFKPSLVAVVTEGTAARTGTLDPIGADIADGPGLYFTLIQQMADNMRDCLTP